MSSLTWFGRRHFIKGSVAYATTTLTPGQFAYCRPEQPKVALALGAGSLHGIAHIGILKACEEVGLRPSLVTGTSAGAIVGGLWAYGLKAVQLRVIAELTSDSNIEDLAIPFSAVATDLATGQRTVLDKGSLARAIAASSCIPGLFEPVKIGGIDLVDGALTEPVPVRTARELGATHVVAVDVHAHMDSEHYADALIALGTTAFHAQWPSIAKSLGRGSSS
ncbi:MAG: patatin-like phospholipase family protein [Burkholderiaceae bacterium]